MGFFFLLNKKFPQKTYKNNDLAYKQIIPTERAQQITIENMFWYSISVYLKPFMSFLQKICDIHFKLQGFT